METEDTIERLGIKVLPSGLVTRAEAAKYLGRKPQTLAHWASLGTGPTHVNVMGRSHYRLDDLRAFATGGA